MQLLTTISNVSKAIGTYDMGSFTRTEEENSLDYLEYNEENKEYKIKKSGWYIIDIDHSGSQRSGYCNMTLNLFLNNNCITYCAIQPYETSNDYNSKTLTIYLTKNDVITCNRKIETYANNNWNSAIIHIWILE